MMHGRGTHRAIQVLGWLLLAFVVIYGAQEAARTWVYTHRGNVRTTLRRVSPPDAPRVVIFHPRIEAGDFAGPPYPALGDTLLAINDSSVQLLPRRRFQWDGLSGFYAANAPVPVRFVHQGDTLETALAMHPPPSPAVRSLVFHQTLRFVAAFAGLAIGLLALRTGAGATAHLLALFAFAAGLQPVVEISLIPNTQPGGLGLWLNLYLRAHLYVLIFLGGAFWLHLMFRYPRPLASARRHPLAVAVLCYTPVLLLEGLFLDFWTVRIPGIHALAGVLGGFQLAKPIVQGALMLAAFGILIYRFRLDHNRVERRQLRLLLWASALSLPVQLAVLTVMTVFVNWHDTHRLVQEWAPVLSFAATLLWALAVYHGFRKYRLMEVEAKLRRSTRYAATTASLVGVAILIVYAFSQFALNTLGIDNATPRIALAFVLALVILPTQKRIHQLLERRFYPERAKLRSLLAEFLQQASTLPEPRSFWQTLEQKLREGLKVQWVLPLLRGPGERLFAPDSPLVAHFVRQPRPVPIDEAFASGRVPLVQSERRWLEQHHTGLLVPLVLHGELVGVLAIGQREDGEDYDPESLGILQSLAPQIAMAWENLRLQAENLDKKRMEQELAMARQTQEALLPHTLPATPGLEVAATCRFCLEVAGDYYDVIPLSGGRTALAVADVSGKGAGAALLMSALKAALQTSLRMNPTLPQMIASLNDLIYHNSRPEQFITCFVGIFEADTCRVTYVNAGHNAPLLIHADGTSTPLEAGGLMLGVIPGLAYEAGQQTLQPGDLLLLYTDGVTEAADAADELFGEERLAQCLTGQGDCGLGEALERIERTVVDYHGSATFDDDFTLLLARPV